MTLAQIIANLPALVVAIPLLLAPVAALIPFAGLTWALAVAGTGGALFCAVMLMGATAGGKSFSYALGSWPPPWGIEFVVDPVSAFTVLVMAALAFVATLFARTALLAEIAEADAGKAYSAWLLACGGLSGLVMTGDAFNLFVFLEISALSSVILIALGAGKDRRALIAGYNYLVIGAVGATFYVIGVGFIYAVTGSLNMADLAERIPQVPQTTVVMVGFGFMMAGLLVKAAIFPVHVWLPAAYAFAPSAVSALLAAIATKASLYVIARVMFGMFAGVPDLAGFAAEFILVPLALAGIFLGTILAIYENDIKKLLAFSSVAQIGYIALGFGLASTAGLAAGFIHIGNHALIKGGTVPGCRLLRGGAWQPGQSWRHGRSRAAHADHDHGLSCLWSQPHRLAADSRIHLQALSCPCASRGRHDRGAVAGDGEQCDVGGLSVEDRRGAVAKGGRRGCGDRAAGAVCAALDRGHREYLVRHRGGAAC